MPAQTYDEIIQEILSYQECFDGWNRDLHNESIEIDGKPVKYCSAENFTNANFFISDTEYEEIDGMPSINEVYNMFREIDNSFHIAAHGIVPNGDHPVDKIEIGGKFLTAEQVAPLILKHLKQYELMLSAKKEPFSIVLHSCKAGLGENCFAAQLSKILEEKIRGVSVIAADDIVWFDNNSTSLYPSEKICSTKAQEQDDSYPGKNWIVFKDGKKFMEGETTCEATIQKVNAFVKTQLLLEAEL
ncbi:MAG: hypothetical protein ACI3ZQ_06540 [Candidatus Cryptobacteroides sp.]